MKRLTKSGAISGKDINELLDESNENQMGKTKAYYKLQKYEDVEEQGRLLIDVKMTNADRIRNMSDEELAEFIHKMEVTCFVDIIGYANKDCGQGKISCRECQAKAPTILDWLQSEVE